MENTNTNAASVAAKTRRTVSGILWDKCLDSLERSSWGSLAWTLCRVVLSLVLAASLFDVHAAASLFVAVAKWADFAVPKTLGAFAFVFAWRLWAFLLRKCWEWVSSIELPAPAPVREEVPTFYGVPVVELVEYLFAGDGSFRRDDVEARFAMPRNKFDEMAKKMDGVKIFVRGENNARKLNPDFSRSDVSSMLFSAVESGELRPLMRKESECSYTSRPSMPDLVAACESPTPSHGFTVRRLDNVSAS